MGVAEITSKNEYSRKRGEERSVRMTNTSKRQK